MGFRPKLLVAVVVRVRNLLDGGPPKHSVMSDEWSHVAVGHRILDGGVDQVGEEGDAVLEESVNHLHYPAGELHDAHVWGTLHFAYRVQQTVCGHPRVAVDQQDVVANSDVAVGPHARRLVQDTLKRLIVGTRLVVSCPGGWTLIALQVVLDLARQHEPVVHVRRFFELAPPHKLLAAMFGTCSPSNVMVLVEIDAGLSFVLVDDL